jgi:transcriptional regulator with XRE-family HTH domain
MPKFPHRLHGDAFVAFGRAVRETRVRRNHSQESLGVSAKLHRNYVGAIERGEINPTLRVIRKLARALTVQASELLALAEERERELHVGPDGRPSRRRRTPDN